jgi:very-short-patch-repair endonuclease
VVVELDGPIHDNAEAREYDAERDRYFKELGITTLRFTNTEMLADISLVRDKIIHWVKTR